MSEFKIPQNFGDIMHEVSASCPRNNKLQVVKLVRFLLQELARLEGVGH
jgi:hypothetical protein